MVRSARCYGRENGGALRVDLVGFHALRGGVGRRARVRQVHAGRAPAATDGGAQGPPAASDFGSAAPLATADVSRLDRRPRTEGARIGKRLETAGIAGIVVGVVVFAVGTGVAISGTREGGWGVQTLPNLEAGLVVMGIGMGIRSLSVPILAIGRGMQATTVRAGPGNVSVDVRF